MQWQGISDKLIIKLQRQALESVCGAYLGHALPRPIEFQLAMDLNKEGGLAWRQLIAFLTTSQFITGANQHSMVTSQIEQLLATTLLTRHPNNYSEALANPASTYCVQQGGKLSLIDAEGKVLEGVSPSAMPDLPLL